MQVHYSTANLPRFHQPVVTIGTFDGVHAGHRKIIEALQLEAAATGGETVVITFHPHPRKVVNTATSLQVINTLEEKIFLLAQTGINHLVVVPFNEAFATLTATEYIQDFLVRQFHPAVIVIGYDHHFGAGRTGNFQLLQQYAGMGGYRLQEIPKHVLSEVAVSSTKIRNAILAGNIGTANKLLGYPFFFEGMVVHGDKLGRTLGYPTANLTISDPDKIKLAHGVYAVDVLHNQAQYKGMLSIGVRPTLKASEEKIEVNIFGFAEEIYDQTLRITVKQYLRGQEKYNSLDELTAQLAKDKEASLAVL